MPEIEVPGAPVPKARPRLGKGHVFTPRATEVAEHWIRETWCLAGWPCYRGVAVRLEVHVRVSRPLAHFGARGLVPSAPAWPAKRPDWDNYAKTACDALNGVAYADDGQVVTAFVTKRFCRDGEAPGWRIGVFMEECGSGDEDHGRPGAVNAPDCQPAPAGATDG